MFDAAEMADLAKRMRRIMSRYSEKEARKVRVSRRDGKRRLGRRTIGCGFANALFDAHESGKRNTGFDIAEVAAPELNAGSR